MRNYKYISILLFFILAACGEKEAGDTKPFAEMESNQERVSDAAPAVMETTSSDTSAIAETKQKPRETGMLDPQILEAFLPNAVINFRKLPCDYGRSASSAASFTSATCEYLGKTGGNLSITMFDYGSNASIPNELYFHNLPEEAGYETSRISIKGGLAYQLWNSKKRSGKFRALLNNRFIITIDANMLPAHSFNLKSLYDKIVTDKLLKL